ncbi:MAG: hypothetical protein ACKOXQ_03250 [Hydrogenophaga sp.]
MSRPRSWLLLCALHGVASVLLWWVDAPTLQALIWRADDALLRPWVWWTSAWVDPTTASLIGHQLALGGLAAFAWAARPPWHATLAWCLAWPLAQASLGLWPQIGYAQGLTGVLHAAWAVLAVQLLLQRIGMPQARRWGGLLLLGLLLKLGLEQAWHHPVVWDRANERSLVQALHLTGAVWGLLLGTLTAWLPRRWPTPRDHGPAVNDSIHP